MLSWMQDYWYLCAIAVLIGIATGWWIWAQMTVAKPDVGRPDLAVPKAAMPDVAVPEAKLPNLPMPDVPMPDVRLPDAPMPAVPQVAVPDVTLPDVAAPGVAMPSPVVPVPDAPMPDVAMPVAPMPDVAAPAMAPHAAPAHAIANDGADDLLLLKGVGPKLAALLNSLGVTRFAQIAAWTDADIARVDAQLGAFSGRIERDNWVEQAALLAAGDRQGFEARFGAL
jgi:predicted flap endonuclease-1-like 5' DNA nuclease